MSDDSDLIYEAVIEFIVEVESFSEGPIIIGPMYPSGYHVPPTDAEDNDSLVDSSSEDGETYSDTTWWSDEESSTDSEFSWRTPTDDWQVPEIPSVFFEEGQVASVLLHDPFVGTGEMEPVWDDEIDIYNGETEDAEEADFEPFPGPYDELLLSLTLIVITPGNEETSEEEH